MSKEEVNNFIFAFEDLVKSYSRNLITNNSNVSSNSKKVDLFRFVEKGEKAETINYDTVEKSGFLNEKFNYFMYILEKTTFDHGLIPYDKVTDIVFSGAPEDIQYSFTEELIKQGTKYFEKKEPEIKNESFERNKTCFYKIVRHINLALVQKNSISARKIEQITELQNANEKLNSQYLQLKRDADKQIEAIKKKQQINMRLLKMTWKSNIKV
ncbi:hypothetical protein NG54_17055 [Heyndrickxia ginsengihumi]|uniref:Uncharacterized protein n=1 Tax=Heyndrickxia ginsengihumi TaxID=363870 RepID=A0A0A6V9E9_9BACI|nr:hypothetical protein [Heyndrickxia ginsengihumi]KHD84201.1 hypothetical protein NG54_17055 [Heyndrickxia ginsengihumi]